MTAGAADELRPPAAMAALAVTLAIQSLVSTAVIAPAAVAPVIVGALHLGAAAVGLFVAVVYAGAMTASVLCGPWLARLGPIRTSQIALAIAALGLLLLASGWLPAMALGACVLGLGYGPITPASSQILARTTPAHRMGFVFSLKQTGVPLGGVIAGLVVPPLSLLAGWQAALAAVAGAALLCAVAAQPLRAALDGDQASEPGRPLAGADWLRPVRIVWSAPALRTLALSSFVFSAVQVCLTAYLVSYLSGALRFTLVAAGAALAVSQACGVGGRLLWGWIADRGLGARRMLVVLAALMIASGLAMPLLGPDSPPGAVLALLALYGGTAIGWNGVYLATVARLAGPGEAGLATGGTLAFTFLGVVIGPPLFGWMAASAGHALAYAATALPLAACLIALRRQRWPA